MNPNEYNYAHCTNCGREYFDKDMLKVSCVGVYGDGSEYGTCPSCGRMMLLIPQDEEQDDE